jgi:thiamine pyrophosphokinase
VRVRALVIANGDPPSESLVRVFASRADLVVAADGGADKALAFGLTIDAVVGDLDSASDVARTLISADRFHQVTTADRTDLYKAISFAIERGASDVDVLGAGGGRADHALGNLSMLTAFRGLARLAIHDDLFEISLVQGASSVDAPAGTVVSLVAIGACTGVTTNGLRWDLHDRDLAFSPHGIHNEIATSPATIAVRSGDLLLFRGRWIERHR